MFVYSSINRKRKRDNTWQMRIRQLPVAVAREQWREVPVNTPGMQVLFSELWSSSTGQITRQRWTLAKMRTRLSTDAQARHELNGSTRRETKLIRVAKSIVNPRHHACVYGVPLLHLVRLCTVEWRYPTSCEKLR